MCHQPRISHFSDGSNLSAIRLGLSCVSRLLRLFSYLVLWRYGARRGRVASAARPLLPFMATFFRRRPVGVYCSYLLAGAARPKECLFRGRCRAFVSPRFPAVAPPFGLYLFFLFQVSLYSTPPTGGGGHSRVCLSPLLLLLVGYLGRVALSFTPCFSAKQVIHL